MVIRPVTQGDLPDICAIEERVNITPWTYQAFSDSLLAGHSFIAAQRDDSTLGYLIGMQVVDEATLLHIAVARDVQRQGVASSLLNYWLSTLDQQDEPPQCWLEVRSSNVAAKHLYQSYGFEYHGVRKRYYRTQIPDVKEDALIYRRAPAN